MKKALILAALLVAAAAYGQTPAETHKARYERQVRLTGDAGVGVETILDRWEADCPDDPAMLEGRYRYCLNKSLGITVVAKEGSRYLGKDPVVTLKDSLGRDVNYFEDNTFVDSLFARSQTAITRAIALEPAELAYRIDKITALMLYEKDCPDLATAELLSMIDYHRNQHPAWTYYGEAVDDGTFVSTIQEYCYNFFNYGTPGCYEAFKTLSESMLKIYPKNTGFLANLGSYWLVYKKDSRKALKWYNKVLKIDPKDYIAAKNCVVMARKDKNLRLEKKYLPVLIAATENEMERKGYEARLDALNKK